MTQVDTQQLELILGGARSGKSALAEQRAGQSGLDLYYVATAAAGDDEMAARIAHHKARRGKQWTLVEAPLQLADTLQANAQDDRCIVVDCLTLWLSNCLHEDVWAQEKAKLLDVLPVIPGHIILVSNETGLGVVPLGALTRSFVDESGFLHQALAGICDRVTLAVAGLPLQLKPQAGA